jgi:hypothetical protein
MNRVDIANGNRLIPYPRHSTSSLFNLPLPGIPKLLMEMRNDAINKRISADSFDSADGSPRSLTEPPQSEASEMD